MSSTTSRRTNTMRATFPPQSSDSREPTPKPSDRPALSLALSTALSREDRLGSGESRVDRHLIYGTPEAPHRALTIGRASSEDSGLRQSLYGSEKAPAENSPGVYNTSSSSRSSESLFTPHDRTSDSPSTPYSAVTSSTTTTSSSSDGPTSHIKPLDLDTSPPGDATPAASDSFTFVSIAGSDSTQKTLSKQQMAGSRTPPGGSSSEANRPSVGNRGRAHSQTARRNLQPHPRSQSFVNPASLYPRPTHRSEQASSPSVPPYPHSPLTHQPYPPPSVPPFTGATTPSSSGGFMGSAGTYSMTPPVNMVPQNRPTYHYPHPSLHAHDASGSLMHPQNPAMLSYGSNTLVPMMQQGYSTYTPVPPHPPHGQHSSEGSSPSSHSYTPTASAGAHSPAGPPQQQSSSPSFTPQPPPPGYSRFPPSPYSPYPPHAYGHTSPMYPATYSTYPGPGYTPSPLESPEAQGTWYYVPSRPSATSGYEGYHPHTAYAYPPNPLGTTDLETSQGAYPSISNLGSGLYPISPRTTQQSPIQHPLGSPLSVSSPLRLHSPASPQLPSPSLPPSLRPPPSQPIPIRSDPTGHNEAHQQPPSSGPGGPGRVTDRRSYHPNPPASRSEWVMWAGNVPTDASHDELWRFFNQIPSPGTESIASSTGTVGSSGSMPTSIKSNPNPPIPTLGRNQGHGRGGSLSSQFPSGPGTSSSSSGAASGPPVLPSQVSVLNSSQSSQQSQAPVYGGVQSIFLIARSNCAFVNFETAGHLQSAIQHFNGVSLRPNDPRCARLVCRVRNKEDDLKAGVGAQRGSGIHMKWIKQQKEHEKRTAKMKEVSGRGEGSPAGRKSFSSSSEPFTSPSSSPHPSFGSPSDDDSPSHGIQRRYPRGKPTPHSSSSGSLSTNSSILSQYFPKRYFILKSLTQSDLDLSVQKGLWATQKHNEGILDQAFRTSREVYLIFSVNKSGEFYGYARMVGPILRGEHQVSWASRTDSASSRRASNQSQRSAGPESPTTCLFFSPSEQRLFDESPLPVSPDPPQTGSADTSNPSSAPPELGPPHHRLSKQSPAIPPNSLDTQRLRRVLPVFLDNQEQPFELDSSAPIRAAIRRSPPHAPLPGHGSGGPSTDDDGVKRWDMVGLMDSLRPVQEDEELHDPLTEADLGVDEKGKGKLVDGPDGVREDGPVWGESFKIEWVRTERLPFNRTKHLRNPWNHDREVKVSRDGTELEPSVGQSLLEEWDKPDPALQDSPDPSKTGPETAAPPTHSSGRGRGR